MSAETPDKLERIEFLIARRRDGDLSPAESAELEQRLREQPELEALADEYDRLDDVLQKFSADTSAIDWNAYRREIHDRVNEPALESVDVEFLLSRRDDGDLTDEEASQLQQALQQDPSLQGMADGYDRLNDALGELAGEHLPVNWQAYEHRLSKRLVAERARPFGGNRIFRLVVPAALAACVALVSSLYWSEISPKEIIEVAVNGRPVGPTSEVIVQVAYAGGPHPAEHTVPPEMVLAVTFNKKPPSANWRPHYEELGETSGYIVCRPDPGPAGSVKMNSTVF